MESDQRRVVIIRPDPPRRRFDNSPRGLSIAEHGEAYLAICGFLVCTLLPLGLIFDPRMEDVHAKVATWIGVVTFFVFVKYIAEKSTGSDEEGTILPSLLGGAFCVLLITIGNRGFAGLLSVEGFIAVAILIGILIATIAMALDRVWEPLVLVTTSTGFLAWLAQASYAGTVEAAAVGLVSITLLGLFSGLSMLIIAIQRPDP